MNIVIVINFINDNWYGDWRSDNKQTGLINQLNRSNNTLIIIVNREFNNNYFETLNELKQ